MKVKALAMAACMGFSLNAFAQSYDAAGRDSADRQAESQRMHERMNAERAAGDSRCGEMRGRERIRCMEAQASAGAGSVPLTQQPGASGPGAVDKTRPGSPEAGFSGSPRDVGTSSAGSGA